MGEVRKKNLITLSIIIFGLFYFFTVHAASMIFLIPAQGEYLLKSNIPVKVLLNTEEPQLTQISATLAFDPTMLQVVNLSTGNSRIKKWLVGPSYSNNNGKVSFVGILGDDNQNLIQYDLLDVTFKAIKSGKTSVQVNSGNVVDDKARNTVGALGSAEFNIIESQINENPNNQLLTNSETQQVNKLAIQQVNQEIKVKFNYYAFLPFFITLLILVLIIVLVVVFLRNNRPTY